MQNHISEQSSSYLEHQKLVHEILLKIGTTVRVWKNATGVARFGKRTVAFGLKGSADIIGLLPGGRFLAIEVKTGNAKQNKDQKNFQIMIEKMGGLYILARSTTDVLTVFEHARTI